MQDIDKEKCTSHGWVTRELHQSGDQVKATCPRCGQFIKFVNKSSIQEWEVVHKASTLF